MSFFHYLCAMTLSLLALTSITQAQDQGISLAEAVNLSISRDEPAIIASLARAESIRAASQSESALPDPKIKLGLVNFPASSFDFNREPMSHIKLGLHQEIPSGTRRRLIRERGQDTGKMFEHQATAEQLLIIRKVRRLWIQLLFTNHADLILLERKEKLQELTNSLEGKYLSGKSSSQNLLLLEAEMALLDDKQEQLAEEENITRLKLARYIGDKAMMSSPIGPYSQLPEPTILSGLEDNLFNHPALQQHTAKIRAEGRAIGLAREDYKPNWGFDVGYGFRSGGRSDLLTAMVTFDIPIFTGRRQDKKLYSAQKLKQAAVLTQAAIAEDMRRNLKVAFEKWRRTSKRLTLYETHILERTQAAAKAAEKSYATGSSSYDDMIRIFLGELDVRLKIEELKMITAQAQADLAYFNGEIQ
ncbi:MAG: TolC family protein [Emcibacter sp.]|nr:TolC family protein [Emcibacter sp.]